MRVWLEGARVGDLLMCHPGAQDLPGDPIGTARLAEYDVLAGQPLGDLLRLGGISLRPMSMILAAGALDLEVRVRG